MLRGGISSLVVAKTLTIASSQEDVAPISLITSDLDEIVDATISGADAWAPVIEIVIGIWLLWRQMGAVAVAPVLVAAACVLFQTWLTRFLPSRQKIWMEAIQRRVGVASTVVRSL